METREEKLATWADLTLNQSRSLRVLQGSLALTTNTAKERVSLSENTIHLDQVKDYLQNAGGNIRSSEDNNHDGHNLWHFRAISFPRLRPGRLVLSMPKQTLHQIQESWDLHPRTVEVFLSNNGVFTTFDSSGDRRRCLLFKVANSRSTGFDCVSVTWNLVHRTTYVLYHHLESEAAVFATLLSAPERCIDPHSFVAALYRSHHQHIEAHRNSIDDTVQGIERLTGFGRPGRLLGSTSRPSLDNYPVLTDPKGTIQQLSYCQTDLAIIGHVARCHLDCGEWLIQAIDEHVLDGQPPHNSGDLQDQERQCLDKLKSVRLMVRQDVEYVRRRAVTLLSQVQQMKDRAQSQTGFMLATITQTDAEYTASIAEDGKRDSIAMKTISLLGIIFLPGTFVATLFSINMFDWGSADGGLASSPTVSRYMWIYWAITVPLTLLTFLVWVFWSRRETRKSTERLLIRRRTAPVEPESAAAAAVSKISGVLSGEKIV